MRKSLPTDTRALTLHEAGYRCGNPACRMPLTLEIHHLDPVAKDGGNTPDNLLALCPNCHTMHHAGHIPIESLRAWKHILLSLNSAFDRESVDLLLTIKKLGAISISADGVLQCAALIASGDRKSVV